MLFSRTFYNWENKKSGPLQWRNTSRWPFWNATQPLLFGNYLSQKRLMLTKVPSSWQERTVSFLSTESLCDRSKVKLLKAFCLFTFFSFLRNSQHALFCSVSSLKQMFRLGCYLPHWEVPFPIFCSSLYRILSGLRNTILNPLRWEIHPWKHTTLLFCSDDHNAVVAFGLCHQCLNVHLLVLRRFPSACNGIASLLSCSLPLSKASLVTA